MTAEARAFIAVEKLTGRSQRRQGVRLLVVSRSALYDRLVHTPSDREVSDAELGKLVRDLQARSRRGPVVAEHCQSALGHLRLDHPHNYNLRCGHSTLGGISPANYEKNRQHIAAQAA
jgi:hypothetical protein